MPTAKLNRLAASAPEMAAMNDEMQNTSSLDRLTEVPSVSRAIGRVRHGPQHPAQPGSHDQHHGQPRQHREEQDHVVEAGVGPEVEPADTEIGPGHRDARRGRTEHEAHGVEHLFQQDPEPQRGQGQEHPRQADGRDGDDGPDRDGHQPGQQQGHHPRQPRARGRNGPWPPRPPPRTRTGTTTPGPRPAPRSPTTTTRSRRSAPGVHGQLDPDHIGTRPNTNTTNTAEHRPAPGSGRNTAPGTGCSGTYRRCASHARGVKISTKNKMMNGKPGGSPDNDGTWATYFVDNAPATPMNRPPTNVNGNDEK